MLCRNPYVVMGRAFGCGQCTPCRINKRRIWAHRIELETFKHADNCFVTLTYNDDCLPADGSLKPEHLSGWIKRLRERVRPQQIRFFGVGEYGETSWRPHYHAALFGFPSCVYGRSRYSKTRSTCCPICDLVFDTWARGHVFLSGVGRESANYLAHYTLKKMTEKDDARLQGRYPEFARMSLRPGVGGTAMPDVAKVFMGSPVAEQAEDVPQALQQGRSKKIMGRYLTRKLREACGRPGGTPQSIMDKVDAELLPLREAAKNSADKPSLKAWLQERDEGKIRSIEARSKIWKSKRVI